jgi:hypothetical protein
MGSVGGLTMNDKIVSEIDNQRRKLELDMIKENHYNSVNRDILYMCAQDL